MGYAGVNCVIHPTKAPTWALGTWRSPTDPPELNVRAKAQGNSQFPSDPLTACSHHVGQISVGMGSPWKSKMTLESGIPSQGSPGVHGSLSCRGQSGIWPIFPIFNPTSSSWKPSKHFFFLFVTGIKGSLFTLILLEPSVRNTFKMTAIRDKS